MEIPKVYYDTNMLIDTIMKKAWESYRGGIAGCKISLENLRLEIDDLKREIEKLDETKREDRERYVECCNSIQKTYDKLLDGNKYSLRSFIDKLNCERLGIDSTELKQIDEDKPIFSLEDNSMTNDETQALLDDLQEEKRETVYPTQDVDQLFEPFEFPNITSENPIQPRDLETHNNLPR